MSSDNSLLLSVARTMRYRTLTPMIGEEVTISARLRISTEVSAFVARFIDECSFSGPEQKIIDLQIAKYGILDLRFAAPPRMFNRDMDAGIPLLRRLGFINSDAQGTSGELGSDSICLEELRDGIAENETHLLLFLESTNPKVSEMSVMDRMARIRDPLSINFPIVFKVVDACVSNSSFVWMNKHFYL